MKSLILPTLSTLLPVFPAILATTTHGSSCSSANLTAPPILPHAIPLNAVPSTFAKAGTAQPADTIAQILNTLSFYPLSVDGKAFSSLSLVFTENAVANFSAPVGVLTGLAAIEASLEKALKTVTTQHAYGTQIVEVLSDCEARSVSYFTASEFGTGKYAGQVVYAYGQYQDTFILTSDNQWRIQTRNLVYMGPAIGNLSILSG